MARIFVPRWAPITVAILLLLSAALVAFGVAVESAQATSGTSTEVAQHTEGEQGEGEHAESDEDSHSGEAQGVEGASIAGIPLESPLFIGGLAAASLVLAVAVWRRPGRITAWAAIAFTIAAAVFDVSEIQHQASEGNTALLAIAIAVVLVRLATIACSIVILRHAATAQPQGV